MKYEEIYSRSYMKKYDPNFYKDKDFAYETMKEWLHEIVAFPYVRKKFTSIVLDDDLEELTYALTDAVDDDYDDNFVIKLFTDGFVICWLRPKVDSVLNTSIVIGGKDEKKILSTYKDMTDRLDSLEIKHKKYVRDHGYNNGTIGTE